VIVAVDLADRPAERGPLIGQRIEVHRSLGEISLLQSIAIDDDVRLSSL